ncbi:MAG: DUF3574 domain-containing protein [Pyrinomonadaceae bacterium]
MKKRLFFITTLSLVLIGSAELKQYSAIGQTKTAARPAPKFNSFLRTELFFGMDKPTGEQVTETEWQKFVEDIVTPRFPDGLTIDDALGQYLDGKTLVREKSKQLILIYPRKFKTTSSRKIEEIRSAYIKAFDQKSVLRVDLPHAVLVSF